MEGVKVVEAGRKVFGDMVVGGWVSGWMSGGVQVLHTLLTPANICISYRVTFFSEMIVIVVFFMYGQKILYKLKIATPILST